MAGDIRFDGDTVEVEGQAVFSGQVVSTQQEITSRGPVAGFSFTDRSDAEPDGSAGSRFVWYADQDHARLWSAGDVLTIGWNVPGQLHMDVPGVISARGLVLSDLGSVKGALDQLVMGDKQQKARIAALETAVAALQTQVVTLGSQAQDRVTGVDKHLKWLRDGLDEARAKLGLPPSLDRDPRPAGTVKLPGGGS